MDGLSGRPGLGQGRIGATPRPLRWVLLFDTRSGQDYLRQLRALGAILAVPEGEGKYRVFRDLSRQPAVGKVEDLSTIRRIFWIDSKRESVDSLTDALGIKPPPSHIVAFFPAALEDHLLNKELKYRNRREEDIRETRFRIVGRGGRYEPEVEDQR